MNSLFRNAVTTYVLHRNVDVTANIPFRLMWVEKLACVREKSNIKTVQECAVLLDDKLVIRELCEIGFHFGMSDVTLALVNHKNESLKVLIEIGSIEEKCGCISLYNNVEITAATSGNTEAIKILIEQHPPTVNRLLMSECSDIITYGKGTKEWTELYKYVRDTIKPDLQLVFLRCSMVNNIEALKGLDNPDVDYPYPEHINSSKTLEFYNYFVSRGLTPNTRLFVETNDINLVNVLLESGMRPTQIDILNSIDTTFEKIKLYQEYGIKISPVYLRWFNRTNGNNFHEYGDEFDYEYEGEEQWYDEWSDYEDHDDYEWGDEYDTGI
jgi:hypothetical protein